MSKATVKTTDLIKALAQINRVNGQRTTLPITHSMLMEFRNNRLTIHSTDLERAAKVTIKCEADEPFRIVVSKGIVSKFVRANSPTTVFTTGKESPNPVSIVSQEGVGKMNVIGSQPKDFPPMPDPTKPTDWLTLDAKWFCRMLGIVSTACAPDESRPVLTGISFKEGAMAAADGFRLHVVKSDKLKFGKFPEVGLINTHKDNVIVPHTTALVAQKLFEKEDSIQIAIDSLKNQIHFISKDISLSSQLIQGAFPQYEQLIPQSFNSRLTVSAPLLIQRLAMIDTSMGSGFIRMFVQEQGILNLGYSDPELMDYEMTVPAKTDVNAFKIGMAHKYLLQAIQPFSLCHLEMSNPSSPLKVTGDIEELMAVVMPAFLQWN